MELEFDSEKGIAYVRLTGHLDEQTILAAFDQVVADERYRPGMGRLWDFREADLSGLDSATIRRMAHYSLRFPPGINDVKVAFATDRDLEFGLSRMFEGMALDTKTPIAVFRSVAEAEAWMVTPAGDTDL